jgi:ArsR family transcriptional regulator
MMENKIARQVAEVLKAVGHPVRLQIIEVLEKEELTVGRIGELTTCAQAVISRHLGLMKDKGVLDCRRVGTKVYYQIANPNVIKLLHCVYHHCDASNSA